MIRKACLYCTAKHLGQAAINIDEAELGYPHYWILAIGQLAEAEVESLGKWPALSKAIRKERTRYMKNRNYKLKLMQLIATVHEMINMMETEQLERRNKVRTK